MSPGFGILCLQFHIAYESSEQDKDLFYKLVWKGQFPKRHKLNQVYHQSIRTMSL